MFYCKQCGLYDFVKATGGLLVIYYIVFHWFFFLVFFLFCVYAAIGLLT
jgi:hypothetical protein